MVTWQNSKLLDTLSWTLSWTRILTTLVSSSCIHVFSGMGAALEACSTWDGGQRRARTDLHLVEATDGDKGDAADAVLGEDKRFQGRGEEKLLACRRVLQLGAWVHADRLDRANAPVPQRHRNVRHAVDIGLGVQRQRRPSGEHGTGGLWAGNGSGLWAGNGSGLWGRAGRTRQTTTPDSWQWSSLVGESYCTASMTSRTVMVTVCFPRLRYGFQPGCCAVWGAHDASEVTRAGRGLGTGPRGLGRDRGGGGQGNGPFGRRAASRGTAGGTWSAPSRGASRAAVRTASPG